MNEFQRAAIEYDEQGMFPLFYIGKRPIWREREWTRLALERFFKHAEGIGIDCGKSGRVVVDYDKPEGLEYGLSVCKPTGVIVKSTHGEHHHYRGATGNRVNMLGKGIDIKSIGGAIRMPPTSGLAFLKNEELTDFDECWFPKQIRKPLEPVGPLDMDVREQAAKAERDISSIRAAQGVRDITAFKVACILCQRNSLPEAVAFPILKRWAGQNCDPAFDDDEKRLIHKIREAIKLRH